MNLLRRMFGMARRSGQNDPQERLTPYLAGPPTAGIHVDETTALNLSAVWRAVNFISDKIKTVPWAVYRRDGGRDVFVPDHPLNRVLAFETSPGEMGAKTFRKTMAGTVLLWGNAYAEIERTRAGDVGAMWFIEPWRVQVDRDSRGRIYYEVSGNGAGNVTLSPESIFHVRGQSPNGLVGHSPIRLARESVSLALAMERFGAAYFGNGTHPIGVLKSPNRLSDAAIQRVRESWNQMHQGALRAAKAAILEEGLEWQRIGIPPEEAQFLTSRQFQVAEIARWFGIPPHKLAELSRSTNNNIEHQSQEVVDDCIVPWVDTFEEEAELKLFRPEERGRFFTRMDLMEFMRGDMKAQAEFYRAMAGIGVFDIDQVLTRIGENPLPNGLGKLRLVPMNMVTVEEAMRTGNTARDQVNGAPPGEQ